MAGVRQHSAPNVVGARKLKALLFYTQKRSLYVFSPFGWVRLGATYAIHLRLIGKPVVDFLLVELFRYVLWFRHYEHIYRLEVAVFEGVGHFGPIFQVEGDVPHQQCVHS